MEEKLVDIDSQGGASDHGNLEPLLPTQCQNDSSDSPSDSSGQLIPHSNSDHVIHASQSNSDHVAYPGQSNAGHVTYASQSNSDPLMPHSATARKDSVSSRNGANLMDSPCSGSPKKSPSPLNDDSSFDELMNKMKNVLERKMVMYLVYTA